MASGEYHPTVKSKEIAKRATIMPTGEPDILCSEDDGENGGEQVAVSSRDAGMLSKLQAGFGKGGVARIKY